MVFKASSVCAFGKSLTVKEWIKQPECAVDETTLRYRLWEYKKKGLSLEQAISTPLIRKKKRKKYGDDLKSLEEILLSTNLERSAFYKRLQNLTANFAIHKLRYSKSEKNNPYKAIQSMMVLSKPVDKKYLKGFNETKTLKEWAKDPRCKVSYSVLVYRANNWWYYRNERILTTSARVYFKK